MIRHSRCWNPLLVLLVLIDASCSFVPFDAFHPSSEWAWKSSRRSKIGSRIHGSLQNEVPLPANPFPICLLTSDEVVLPGEVTSISTLEESLVEDCVQNHFGILAVGIFVGQDEDGDDSLAQMASLCEIQNCQDIPDKGLLVTLRCVGRIKLSSQLQVVPHFKYSCSIVHEETGDVKKAELVAANIQAFLKIITRMEISLGRIDEHEETLEDLYDVAFDRAWNSSLDKLQHKETSRSTPQTQLLTATSWAVFTCMQDDPLLRDNYRLRALDWDNLLERLKLAQYALREKELRLQGDLILIGNEDESTPASTWDDDAELGSFQ